MRRNGILYRVSTSGDPPAEAIEPIVLFRVSGTEKAFIDRVLVPLTANGEQTSALLRNFSTRGVKEKKRGSEAGALGHPRGSATPRKLISNLNTERSTREVGAWTEAGRLRSIIYRIKRVSNPKIIPTRPNRPFMANFDSHGIPLAE